MVPFRCDGCAMRFKLDHDIEPFVCGSCSAVLCPLCAEDGCCRPVDPGVPPCAECLGSGLVDVAGDCICCGGLGVVEVYGLGRDCRTCGGAGWLSCSLCDSCGGYGYPARGLQRRSA